MCKVWIYRSVDGMAYILEKKDGIKSQTVSTSPICLHEICGTMSNEWDSNLHWVLKSSMPAPLLAWVLSSILSKAWDSHSARVAGGLYSSSANADWILS